MNICILGKFTIVLEFSILFSESWLRRQSTRPFIDARPFLVSINLLYKVADNLTAIRAATRR